MSLSRMDLNIPSARNELGNATSDTIVTQSIKADNADILSLTTAFLETENITTNNLTSSIANIGSAIISQLTNTDGIITNLVSANVEAGIIAVDNITATQGTIDVGSIGTLSAFLVSIVTGTISTLTSTTSTITTATIQSLSSTAATIQTLISTTATITSATIQTLISTTATIQTLISTTATIQTLTSTAATITSATIQTLTSTLHTSSEIVSSLFHSNSSSDLVLVRGGTTPNVNHAGLKLESASLKMYDGSQSTPCATFESQRSYMKSSSYANIGFRSALDIFGLTVDNKILWGPMDETDQTGSPHFRTITKTSNMTFHNDGTNKIDGIIVPFDGVYRMSCSLVCVGVPVVGAVGSGIQIGIDNVQVATSETVQPNPGIDQPENVRLNVETIQFASAGSVVSVKVVFSPDYREQGSWFIVEKLQGSYDVLVNGTSYGPQ